MMGQAMVWPQIPREQWRERAACSFTGEPQLWDNFVAGEDPRDRARRHTLAKAVCASCPVVVECARAIDWRLDEGVRAGVVVGQERGA